MLGSHIMDLIRMFGGEPQWCFATVMQNGKPITAADVKDGHEGIGPLAGDAVQAMYGMPDGSTAYFGSHRNMAGKRRRFGLQIFGRAGVIEILTGYLPSVQYLDDPVVVARPQQGRSGRSHERRHRQARAAEGRRPARRQRGGGEGPDRGDRGEPAAEVQRLRSPRRRSR